MIPITVDGQKLEVEAGANLLAACLAQGIYIPHLCHVAGLDPPPASCRLCFVEIAGRSGPVPACTVDIAEPLVVQTASPAARRLQKAGLKLLLSVHRVDCRNCPANRRCELQRIARFLKTGLSSGKLERRLKEPEVDSSHPCLDYYPNRCVLCGQCIHACREQHRNVALTFVKRGFETLVGSYSRPQAPPPDCLNCRACIEVCPVAALLPKQK
jgi:bidirectional [NiFe] hydrogenase diaphorase subunit